MTTRHAPVVALMLAALVGCARPTTTPRPEAPPTPHADVSTASTPAPRPATAVEPSSVATGDPVMPAKSDKVVHTDAEWRKLLTPEQYRVMREKGTERAFTGKYWDTKTHGVYKCAACGEPLFESDAKFDSGCGWPSFFKPLDGAKLVETEDRSWGVRTEITCAKCGAHMGHVFDDGPAPTHLRYCINSVSIELVPDAGTSSEKDLGKSAK